MRRRFVAAPIAQIELTASGPLGAGRRVRGAVLARPPDRMGCPAESGQADPVPLRFPGHYADPETGLHYNLHHYYDPATARYTTPTPSASHHHPTQPATSTTPPSAWRPRVLSTERQ